MKQDQVPVYIDPDDFENRENLRWPNSTQYMVYKTMVSRYFLTPQALEDYGIYFIGKQSPKQLQQFITEVTDDLYTAMADIAPFNYQYNAWLVAQSRSAKFPNRYACRQQFEKALIYQAQYRVRNADVRDFNGIDLDAGQSIYFKQLRKEHRHISPKSLDILKSLGLFFNGDIPGRHLINFSEGM